MERPRPIINLRIPVAMIEQKLEGIRSQIAGKDTDLVAQLAASLAVRKISIPDANCRVGKSYRQAGPPPAQTGRAAVPSGEGAAASKIRDENAEAGIADILSPSQVRTFRDCSARWQFKYVWNLPDSRESKRAVGTAAHDAIAYALRQKIESGKDLPIGEVETYFDTAWQAILNETVLRADEDAGALAATGKALTRKFLLEEAASIQPIAVEQELTGTIAGVAVHGFLDLIETNGRIREIKTRAAKPNGIEPDHLFQLATYAQLAPGATGQVRVDYLVKTKTPQHVPMTHTLTDEDYRETEVVYPLVQEAMRNGLAWPNRGGMLCSRRNCAFWKECQNEFGGTVSLT